ncbi:pseudouridine synthase deg1 [Friedmanniomyces endolithicus]|nr:pseudouridine synthase deg1 [Friedmanniomyces endolithicus]KAK0814946.1 pseudouridine synthase deg1 [Friedmanniomyces endolithicus]KAK0874320.1 pseudouridine synthase deg1 [Friedmanniomyces endolithicus]KAK0913411.1 pseudouridine synthase deg1 [Friedmanniomyces endolithicus]KAK0924004.1 pseudouridine synthase deg1 [Friedmanniomyces endolithicus]
MATSAQPDYTTYTHADLLNRVTDLEAQLRRLNHTTTLPIHPSPPQTSPPERQKQRKPPKQPKPFDPSRHHTRPIALKFAYLGGNYNGFEHHANNATPLPTVEEALWRALRKTRLILPDFAGRGEGEVCWDGCGYSKCGRTDRGVSAFGQVVGVRVRSCRPKVKAEVEERGDGVEGRGAVDDGDGALSHDGDATEAPWDPIRDEIPYIQVLNRVLPPDIRILAWCPHPPPEFSARFNCKERRYRYFFTNPAYASAPGSDEGRLEIGRMELAAKKLEGLHDFRNMCKVDASKQITNFERRVFHAGIHRHGPERCATGSRVEPELYFFEVRGSAFLWHQVRHMVAILFLVGQGYEQPDIVDHLLDVEKCPGKPVYEMADDRPLVLWECIFPDDAQLSTRDHDGAHGNGGVVGYVDTLEWIHAGMSGGRDPSKRVVPGTSDGKYGPNGIVDSLWALWRKRKIDEVLAESLMNVVTQMGGTSSMQSVPKSEKTNGTHEVSGRSDRIFDGSERPRTVGKYVQVMQRDMNDAPDVVNARYAARKGLTLRRNGDALGRDAGE